MSGQLSELKRALFPAVLIITLLIGLLLIAKIHAATDTQGPTNESSNYTAFMLQTQPVTQTNITQQTADYQPGTLNIPNQCAATPTTNLVTQAIIQNPAGVTSHFMRVTAGTRGMGGQAAPST